MKYCYSLVMLILPMFLQAQSEDSLTMETYYAKGDEFLHTGNYDSALFYYREVEKISFDNQWYQVYLESLRSQSFTLFNNGHGPKAKEIFYTIEEKALTYLAPDNPFFVTIYTGLATYAAHDHEIRKCEQYVNKLQQWMEQYEHSDIEVGAYANFLLNLGALAHKEGDYYQAIGYLTNGLDELLKVEYLLDTEPELVQILVNAHQSLSLSYQGIRETQKALFHAKQANHFFTQYGSINFSKILHARLILGETLSYSEDEPQALQIYEQLMRDLSRLESERLEALYRARTLQLQGQSYFSLGKLDQAKAKLEQAFALQKQNFSEFYGLRRHEDMGISCLYLGKIHEKQGEIRSAQNFFHQALIHHCYSFADPDPASVPPAEEVNISLNQRFNILYHKAGSQRAIADSSSQIGDYLATLQTYQLMIQLLELDRSRYKTDVSKLFLMEQLFPAFEGIMEVLWQLYQLTGEQQYAELAFEFAERSKAALLKTELMRSEAQIQASLPDSVLTKDRALRKEIRLNQHQLLQEKQQSSPNDSLLRVFRKLRIEYQQELSVLTHQIQDSYPLFHELQAEQKVISIPDIQTRLSTSHTTLLEFFWGAQNIYVIGMDDSQLIFNKLDTTSRYHALLNQALVHLHQGSQQRSEDQSSRTFFELYQWLIASTQNDLPIDEHLIIIPDGPLSYLPFELLQREPDQRSPNYLLERYAISYAQSATLLFQQQARSSAEGHFMGFGPRYEQNLTLPYSLEEVDNLQAIMGGKKFLAAQATKANFLSYAGSANILHFATHAFPNTEHPNLSFLLFHQDSDSLDQDRLYAYELYDIDLEADLAVLSACHTGYGPIARGEGVRSLARAFQLAGCPSVLVSLWEANGIVAKDLMPLFYGYLKEGLPKDVALQRAKLEFLANAPDHLRDPRLWGNFVLIGEAGGLEEKGSFAWWWLVVGVVVVVGIGRLISKFRLED